MSSTSSAFSARRVLLVGGGRWGRVHADILRRVLPEDGGLTWISDYNGQALAQIISNWDDRSPQCRILEKLEEGLAVKQDAAIIVSAPHMHAIQTRTVLQADVPVLVEKPFVMQSAEADELIRIAEQRNLLLGVGLHLLFTSYLRHFKVALKDKEVRAASIEWLDPTSETRYGELKSLDISVQKIHDVFSHIWSIIYMLFPNRLISVSGVSVGARASTEIRLDAAGIEIIARIDRRARHRGRRVVVEFTNGRKAQLDFTSEPGVIAVDGKAFAGASDWSAEPSPLTTETTSFLSALDRPEDAAAWPARAQFVAAGVGLTEEIAERVSEAEATILAEAVMHGNLPESDAIAIISDNVGSELAELGVRGQRAESEVAILLSSLLERKSKEISGDRQSLLGHSKFLQRVEVALKRARPMA